MKHKLQISVSKKPYGDGIMTCRSINVGERLLQFFIGKRRKVAVLIPGESIGEIVICEIKEGEARNGKNEVIA